jgi:hypothetical protein
MAISTSPIPTTPAELDAIKRRLQDPSINIPTLQQYATGSMASIPGYLALGELSRRNSLIQNQQAQGANPPPPPTILQQQAQQAQKPPAPPQGIAQGMPPGAPPPQGGQMPPQTTPQMPQQPPQPPVAAANGGLMELPMRSDMFRRSDYAHGGVVHFDGTEESQVSEPKPKSAFREDLDSFGNRLYNFKRENPTIASILEGLALGPVGVAGSAAAAAAKPIYKYFTRPSSNLSREEQQGIDTGSGQKITTQTTEDPNANIKILPSGPSGGGGSGEGGGGGINKETAKLAGPALKYIDEYLKSENPARITQGDYLEGKREQQLDVLPKTNTSRLEEVQQSYNRPRTWDENLSLMKQDALRARSGAGFSDTDIGGTARVLDASNREKSIAISLKLEEIENLDRKAQFAYRNGQDDKGREIEIERDKLIAEVKKIKGTVAGQAVQGIAGLARMPNIGGGGGGSKTTGLSEQTLAKIDDAVADFIQSPSLNSKFWDYVPNAEAIKKKLDAGKNNPKDDNYKSAIADLQRFRADIRRGYENRLRSGEAEVVKKQVK